VEDPPVTRPTRDRYFMAMAQVVATRSTCLRRQVGCVLINERSHALATGYNGVAAGQPHCNEETVDLMSTGGFGHPYDRFTNACPGAFSRSGEDLDLCEAIHAEQNALLQCRDVYQVAVCYTTTAPCLTCTKLLLGTSCQRVVFIEPYPQAEAAARLWEEAGRTWAPLGAR